jgi:hypothetical protein
MRQILESIEEMNDEDWASDGKIGRHEEATRPITTGSVGSPNRSFALRVSVCGLVVRAAQFEPPRN